MSMMSMLLGAGGGAAFGDATTSQSNDATYTIGGITYKSHTWTGTSSGNNITFTNSSGNGNVLWGDNGGTSRIVIQEIAQ